MIELSYALPLQANFTQRIKVARFENDVTAVVTEFLLKLFGRKLLKLISNGFLISNCFEKSSKLAKRIQLKTVKQTGSREVSSYQCPCFFRLVGFTLQKISPVQAIKFLI